MEFPVSDSDIRIGIDDLFDNVASFVFFLHFLRLRLAPDDEGNIYGSAVFLHNFDGFKNGGSITFVQSL